MSESSNSLPSTITIIWAALSFSQLIYAFIGTIIEIENNLVLNNEMIVVFLLLALILVGVSVLGVPIFVKANSKEKVFTVFIIQWAVIEVISVLGLISRFQGGPDVLFYGMIFLSFVTMVCLFPTKKRAEEMIRRNSLE
jgi:hypothetical protein